jgi:hypothetical protein
MSIIQMEPTPFGRHTPACGCPRPAEALTNAARLIWKGYSAQPDTLPIRNIRDYNVVT